MSVRRSATPGPSTVAGGPAALRAVRRAGCGAGARSVRSGAPDGRAPLSSAAVAGTAFAGRRLAACAAPLRRAAVAARARAPRRILDPVAVVEVGVLRAVS